MTACVDVLLSKINWPLTLKLYRHHGQEERLASRYKDVHNVNFIYCDTYDDTITGADIVISAVTRVTENFCSDEYYAKGCTVIPIMTMGFQNCDLFFDKVMTDEIEQIRGFKYFNQFKSIANTTDVMNGESKGRESDEERILVYNYGLSVMDMYFGYNFYRLAGREALSVEYNYCKEKFFM